MRERESWRAESSTFSIDEKKKPRATKKHQKNSILTSRRGELDTHVELLESHTVMLRALADPASARARKPARRGAERMFF